MTEHDPTDQDKWDAQIVHCSGCGEEYLRRNATRVIWVMSDPEIGYHHHDTADEDLCPRKSCGTPVSESETTELVTT